VLRESGVLVSGKKCDAEAKEKIAMKMLNMPFWAYWVQIFTTSFDAVTEAFFSAFSSR